MSNRVGALAAYPPHLAQGSVVRAWVTAPNGERKRRPVVVLTPSHRIRPASPLVGVAVTGSYPEPPRREHVVLPWGSAGRARTGRVKPSAAVCNWLVELHSSDDIEVSGFVPPKSLREIIERIKELNAADE